MKSLKQLISKKLPKNAFARNASVLIGGTLGAQILTVLVAPLLTRLYSPDDFGLLAVYTSMLAITLLLGSLRYDIAIPLPEDDIDAANLVVLSLLLVGINSLLITLIVLLFSGSIAKMLDLPVLVNYLWLLPLGVLFGGTYNIYTQWSVRTKHFGLIASTKVRQVFCSLAIQLFAFKWGGFALMLGQVAGQGVGATRLAKPEFSKVSFTGVRYVAIRYRRFPIYSSPAGLFRVAGIELPALILAAAFNPAAAGLYALTNRVLSVPAAVLGEAVSQVFVSSAAEAYRVGELSHLVKKLHAKMAQIGLPFMFLLMLLGPELFGVVFGEAWRQAGVFACWMAPWLYLVFVSSPITTVTAVMERQKQGLVFHFTLLIFRIVALYYGVWVGDLMVTIMFLGVVNALWRLVFLLWIYVVSGNTVFSFIMDCFTASTKALLCVTPVIVSVALFNDAWFYALVFSLILIACLYWRLLKQVY